MQMHRSSLCAAALGVALSGLVSIATNAAVVVEYDASTAAALPSAPDWSPEYGTDMTLSGGLLHQNTPDGGGPTFYRSKEIAGLMTRNTTDYTVEFKTQVLLDTPSSDWYTNTIVIWGDNTQSYSLIPYRNGGSGGLRTGSGTTVGNLTDVVTGVSWAAAHQFDITYSGANDNFKIYVDGALNTTVGANSLVLGGAAPEPYWRDRLLFGDYLTGASSNGPTQTDWSSARLFDSAVPEPTSMTLIGIAGMLAIRRKHC